MLTNLRKKFKIDNYELDSFLGNKSISTKYYLDKKYRLNKMFKYFLLLRMKGVNLNAFFDAEIKENHSDYKKPKKPETK